MFASIIFSYIQQKRKLHFTQTDIFIGVYIILMIVASFFTTWIQGIAYGGRYDFLFLVAFLIIYHGYFLLGKPPSYYVRLFLISGGVMIFISGLLKWPLSEDLLLYLGYGGNPSNWQFGGVVPIFHGVDGANVRRFQGLLDGPNTMGAFLVIYMSILVYYYRRYREWYFMIWCTILVMAAMVFYTYSRSAILGLSLWVWIIILFSLWKIFKKYASEMISVSLIFLVLLGLLFTQYAGNAKAIFERWWSTKGHIERMKVGIERTFSHPLGQWLWSAWPAYRYVQNLETKDRKEVEELDRYYIPESWYIQQFVEWGFLWGILFILTMVSIGYSLFRVHIFLFGGFLGILLMNFFLHTFESSIVSLSLFLISGLLIVYHAQKVR